MGRTCCAKSAVGLLLLAALLQIAAIGSPGWLVLVKGNNETFSSVFYEIKCNTLPPETCSMTSYREQYIEFKNALRNHSYPAAIAEFDTEYNHLICQQVLFVTSVALSLLGFLVQWCGGSNVEKRKIRSITFSIITSALSVGIVLAEVAEDFVELAYHLDITSMDTPQDHTYVGFPYSVVMILGSVIIHLVAIACLVARLEPSRRASKKPSVAYEEYDSGPIIQASKPRESSVSNYAYDNTIISEKL